MRESTAFVNWVTRWEAMLGERRGMTVQILLTNQLLRGLVLHLNCRVLVVETVRQIAGGVHRHTANELRGVEIYMQ